MLWPDGNAIVAAFEIEGLRESLASIRDIVSYLKPGWLHRGRRQAARPHHKHTDLKDLFYARVQAQHAVPASEAALREQNHQLQRELNDLRAERGEYKQAADALARALNLLTLENDGLRREASRRRPSPTPLSPVV